MLKTHLVKKQGLVLHGRLILLDTHQKWPPSFRWYIYIHYGIVTPMTFIIIIHVTHSQPTHIHVHSQMGYDGLFFARNDYDDKNQRLKDNTMEMVWRPSKSLGNASDLFTGIFLFHYGPPPGFCFDVKCSDPPIQVWALIYMYMYITQKL